MYLRTIILSIVHSNSNKLVYNYTHVMNVHVTCLSIPVGWWVPVFSEWAGGAECNTHRRCQNHSHGPQYSITSDLCRKICLMGRIYTWFSHDYQLLHVILLHFCLLSFWALAAGIEPFVYYICHFDSIFECCVFCYIGHFLSHTQPWEWWWHVV